MSAAGFTPGPYSVGAQNDALYVIAGRAPAVNNDHPWHEAPRVALAKVYGPTEGDCLPVDADANARLFAAAYDMHAAIENFMPKGIAIGNGNVPDDLVVPMDVTMGELRAFEAALAKVRGAAK